MDSLCLAQINDSMIPFSRNDPSAVRDFPGYSGAIRGIPGYSGSTIFPKTGLPGREQPDDSKLELGSPRGLWCRRNMVNEQ
jgi:hypothetical protein